MELKKIFDIPTKPTDMDLFFRNFIYEFEKTICGGGKGPVETFFEDGPRIGYSTTFKSVGSYIGTYSVTIKFNPTDSLLEVFVGCEKVSGMVMGLKQLPDFMAPFVEAATKKALRRTREMA